LKIEQNSLVHLLLMQLLDLTAASNAQLYNQAAGLGIIEEEQLELKSFHYHVRKLDLRSDKPGHLKRKDLVTNDRPLSLAGCRLFSSPRLSFSVRLIPFVYEAQPDDGELVSYGVLGLVSELCSGMLRAEILCSGYGSLDALHKMKRERVVAFVASAISLPLLKISSVHFPKLRFGIQQKAEHCGLIAGWLGYEQAKSQEVELQHDFSKFSAACIKATKWDGEAYKLRPEAAAFACDFPQQLQSGMLDFTRVCGKAWRLRRVAKEVNRRVDRWNVGFKEHGLNPLLRLWIARQCYSRVWAVDEQRQRTALLSLCRSILYRKRSDPDGIAKLQDFGIKHLLDSNYSIYR
jgi:hypothetical protein